MRPLLSIKTLFRSPVKTMLTFILLGVVTFAFFSQIAEYVVTTREFNNATRQYCGIGSAEVAPPAESYPDCPIYIYTDPRVMQGDIPGWMAYYPNVRYQPLTQEQVSEISAIPYITSADTRYMTAGLSDIFYRLDEEYFYNYTARCLIEGTLGEFELKRFVLSDCKLLAGNPTRPVDHQTIMITPGISNALGAWGGGADRIVAVYAPNYKYGTEYIRNLTPGGRYVFILRFEPNQQLPPGYAHFYYLGDHLTDPWCAPVWPVDGALDYYLQTEEFAPLRELVTLANADAHTFDMVYTEDMSAILRFSEGSMAIINGRTLDREDSASGAQVCVISREVSEAYALKVGDTLPMMLGTELFEQYKALGAVAGGRERYKPAQTPVNLEIVGIYSDTDGQDMQLRKPNWSYSINTIFVPRSLLPIDASQLTNHAFSPSEFSFKVENAWDIPAFLEECAPRFGKMGLRLIFDDDGWPEIADAFRAAQRLSLIKIAVTSAAFAAATGFIVYLYIGRKKKEYAVMRALGTTRKTAARTLILPLMAVAAVSVLAGSCAAWIYTVKTIVGNNALTVLKEYSVSTSLPAEVAIGCITGEILLTLLIALVLLRRVGNFSPLALLQNNGSRQARGNTKVDHEKPTTIEAASLITAADNSLPIVAYPLDSSADDKKTAVSGVPVREVHRKTSFGFVLRYIWKHTRRSVGKSMLAVLLAILLFIAVGQLALMKESYAQLAAETVITAKFVGGLQLTDVPRIMQSGYVKNPYYEFRDSVDLNSMETSFVITNNITRFTGEEADITYADGYDASCMDRSGNIIVAGEALMAKYGLQPGEIVKLNPRGYLEYLNQSYIFEYRKGHSRDIITDAEILALYQREIMVLFNSAKQTYIIAGVITTPSGYYDDTAFSPGDYNAHNAVGKAIKLEVAEFILADNKRVDEFRSYGTTMAGGGGGVTFVMDTSELEHLRNALRLLETLYPAAIAAALLIGGFLCCLVIVQSSKDAALMRIQGTTKRKTRAMLSLEQLFLSIAGLILGAGGLLAYKGAALSVISGQLCLFAALYFTVILVSTVICSALSTRRNVLALLQTKE